MTHYRRTPKTIRIDGELPCVHLDLVHPPDTWGFYLNHVRPPRKTAKDIGGVVVAHKILVTAQRPNSFFLIFGFSLDFGLGLGLIRLVNIYQINVWSVILISIHIHTLLILHTHASHLSLNQGSKSDASGIMQHCSLIMTRLQWPVLVTGQPGPSLTPLGPEVPRWLTLDSSLHWHDCVMISAPASLATPAVRMGELGLQPTVTSWCLYFNKNWNILILFK